MLNKYYYSDGTIEETDRINKSKKLHRLDGPACVYENGNKLWWIDDEYLTKKRI